MADINDKVSQKIHNQKGVPVHGEVIELRYFADYGHGFLGFFRAFFEGRIEEIIKDPGPPYLQEEDIPRVVKTLYSFLVYSSYSHNIPEKYQKHVANYEPTPISKDSLFE